MKLKYLYIMAFVLAAGMYSCGGMNDLHDQYLKRGETIYVAQPDSAVALAGKNRVKIRYWNSDPKVAKLRVYWDFRQDSLDFDVPPTLNEPTDILISGLPEGLYTFEMVTRNKDDRYPSVPFNLTANSYGARYAASLNPRKIIYAEYNPSGFVEISWASVLEGVKFVELEYSDKSGEKQDLVVDNEELLTRITDIDHTKPIVYRTVFQPVDAIDEFITQDVSIKPNEVSPKALDKSKFQRWNPPAIPYKALEGQGDWNKIERMWNGIYGDQTGGDGFSFPGGAEHIPGSFTFDLGESAHIKSFKVAQRNQGTAWLAYTIGNVKKFSLYGSDTTDVDADFDSWTHLGDYVCPVPDPVTNADKTAAALGTEYTVSVNDNVTVRYIRFHVTELFQVGAAMQISELDFIGIVIQ